MKNILCGVLVFVLASGFSLQAQNPPSAPRAPAQPAKVENPQAVPKDYVIGLEDGLAIVVWREPELSVKETFVRPDGKITLPLINDIQASGLTAEQLQEQIAEKLKEFVAAPNVTVIITRISSQKVSIVGEISAPGIYTLGSPMTVLELIAKAGGLREYANKKKIRIVREEGGRTLQFMFNYKDVVQGKNLKQNIPLKNGDIVIVP